MLMIKEAPTIVLFLLCMLGLATAAEQPVAGVVREKIIQIMAENPMVPFISEGGLTFCKAFYDDFRAQKNIEQVEPIVIADDYNSKELQARKGQCPNLQLNKNVSLEPRIAESLRKAKVPEDQWDQFGTVYFGVSNFKLFKVDISNTKEDGDEYVFYEERYTGKKFTELRGGDYKVVDLNNCKIITRVSVDQGAAPESPPAYHGIIKYKGRHYIFDLHVAGYYVLNLEGYNTKRRRMMPVCSYDKAR